MKPQRGRDTSNTCPPVEDDLLTVTFNVWRDGLYNTFFVFLYNLIQCLCFIPSVAGLAMLPEDSPACCDGI